MDSQGIDQNYIREVHHQVKNNLQVVCSLLRIQGREVADPAAREVFRRSEQRIQSMALVYDKLYSCGGCDTVPLREYLADLTRQLESGAARGGASPRIELVAEQVMLSSRNATTMGLLVGELLAGHLRGLAVAGDRGTVTVRVMRLGEHLRLDVSSDSGEEADSQEPRTVEEQIIAALVRQLNGSIESTNYPERRVSVTMPWLGEP